MTVRSLSFARNSAYLAVCAIGAWRCSEAKEAERVELSVVTDGTGFGTVSTDLGYQVELSSARIAASNLKFTIAGEAHTWLKPRLWNFAISEAHAHPGHFQGGEVTGELNGEFVLHFSPDKLHEVGTATLLVGGYDALNLTLSRAKAADVEETDALEGHTAVMIGTATKGDASVEFDVVIDSPVGRELVGVPFDEEITTSTRRALALQLTLLDPLEMDTLFDGIDFFALDGDGDGNVEIEPEVTEEGTVAAYNTIRRAFQTHDHFLVKLRKD